MEGNVVFAMNVVMLGIVSPKCGKVFPATVSDCFACRQVTEDVLCPNIDGFFVITVFRNRDAPGKVAGECAVAQTFFDVAVGEGGSILAPFRVAVNQMGQFFFEF